MNTLLLADVFPSGFKILAAQIQVHLVTGSGKAAAIHFKFATSHQCQVPEYCCTA